MPKKSTRISESDLLIPTLQILDSHPKGEMTTSELIPTLAAHFKPQGEDAEILANRQDTKFSQIVRNMVSHNGSANNIITKGYVEYVDVSKSLRITKKGRDLLDN